MTEQKWLPVLPLRGLVIYPLTVVNLDIGREKSLAALQAALDKNSSILLLSQREADIDFPSQDDLFRVGTIAEIKQTVTLPGGSVRALVEGVARAKVLEISEGEDFFEAAVIAVREETPPESTELTALMRTAVDTFNRYAKLSNRFAPETLAAIAQVEEPHRLADVVASHLPLRLSHKQELLECFDPTQRLERLCSMLFKEIDILEIEHTITKRVRKQMEKTQKEYYLREQMKAIQRELGQQDQRLEEIENYRRRLKDFQASDEVKEKLSKEIDRLSRIPPGVAEGVVIANYLDWCLSLPWETVDEEEVDLSYAEKVLEEDHYGLKEVKERILEYLAVRKLSKAMKGPILCLVGPPGVGKTSLARSVARALNRKFIKASLGGVRDEAEIRGHRRTYVGAMPGRIIQQIKQAQTKNPVFLLDEVDKMSMDFRGDPSAALLEVLDPEQNHAFVDHYIELPFDLSQVLFLTTANAAHRIPAPLLDRMETIYISGYTEEEKLEIAKRHLLPKQRRYHGLDQAGLYISDNALMRMITEYTFEAGVRNLERSIAAICRKAARQIAESKKKTVRVTSRNLEKYLGLPKKRLQKIIEKDAVGVAMGLAWTDAGGETLAVEVTLMPGCGKLTLTGQMGDVMQESAQTALSYVRSRSERFGLAEDFFSKHDIHIHVPEGAIPKDGPSAGITIATALISAVTKRPFRSTVGMTGEITLTGRVLTIGGLKEKVLAAHRAGLKTVVLPKDNQPDLEEIPRNIRRHLKFELVEQMDEVMDVALVKDD